MPNKDGTQFTTKCDCIKTGWVPGDPDPPPPPPSDPGNLPGPTTPPDPGGPTTPPDGSGPTSRQDHSKSAVAYPWDFTSSEFGEAMTALDADLWPSLMRSLTDWLGEYLLLPASMFRFDAEDALVPVVLPREEVPRRPVLRAVPKVRPGEPIVSSADMHDFVAERDARTTSRRDVVSRIFSVLPIARPSVRREESSPLYPAYGETPCPPGGRGKFGPPEFRAPYHKLPECLRALVAAHEDVHFFDAALKAACERREKARDSAISAQDVTKSSDTNTKEKRAAAKKALKTADDEFTNSKTNWTAARKASECAAYTADQECIDNLLKCCKDHSECCPCEAVKKIAKVVAAGLKANCPKKKKK